MKERKTSSAFSSRALVFLLFMGLISLLSDFTHEGARSIYGPYLNTLGVSAFLVALIAGMGELLGYGLRVLTGFILDKTKKYWTMMFVGYAINLLAIPLLALVGTDIWAVALVLMLVERLGKSIRAPAKSVLTSFASSKLGPGKAFAIQEVMDQIGAFLGPLFVFGILTVYGAGSLSGYQIAFGYLGIFAVMTLVVLLVSRLKFPTPEKLETSVKPSVKLTSKVFYVYLFAIMLLAFGFIDFPVISFHFDKVGIINAAYIPLVYAIAMGVDAVSAFVFGTLYDKIGVKSLAIATFISAFAAIFLFIWPTIWSLAIGMLFWAIGMGAQESVLKSVIASIMGKEKRGRAYGIMNAMFGLSWFLGSMVIGALYDVSIWAVIAISVTFQLASFAALIWTERAYKKERLAQ